MSSPPPRLAPYEHFLAVSRKQAWEAEEIDLAPDARAWPALGPAEREPVACLVAGFCVAEAAVSETLSPFAGVAPGREARACFRAQAAEEARHARFFDRVATEVLGASGSGPAERRANLRGLLEPAFLELFEERLPASAATLGEDAGRLPEAVGLYHLILEGVVLSAGQTALLALLDDTEAGASLPGLRAGTALVARDERWHIGFGVRCLQDIGASGLPVERIAAEGPKAVDAWGAVLDPALRAHAGAVHRRRLRAAGLEPREASYPA